MYMTNVCLHMYTCIYYLFCVPYLATSSEKGSSGMIIINMHIHGDLLCIMTFLYIQNL